MTACECGALSQIPYTLWRFSRIKRPLDLDDAISIWHRLVQSYSQLKLSRATDILPALSGLARLHSVARRGRYVAGLWQDSLIKDLIWETSHDVATERPREYCGPTWSWAYRSGHVNFQRIDAHRIPSRIEAVDVDLAGPDAFGQVISGSIIIRGPILETSLKSVQVPGADHTEGKYKLDGVDLKYSFKPDYRLEKTIFDRLTSSCTVYCLLLGYDAVDRKLQSYPNSFWIVLRPVRGQGDTFERLGFCLTWDLWEEWAVIRTVTIV
ncbi:hypothetical protein LTR37_007691 [Vermiconidia calcicola]|uniref:Uncharacterized protein n=1 Tax=Vermiconidia calcicola TaxID=1690605 RepID=A0ACC3ND57_9PEZI|nr:hypothetical protein LTR37_007691 [Vermiconidia calcicola]